MHTARKRQHWKKSAFSGCPPAAPSASLVSQDCSPQKKNSTDRGLSAKVTGEGGIPSFHSVASCHHPHPGTLVLHTNWLNSFFLRLVTLSVSKNSGEREEEKRTEKTEHTRTRLCCLDGGQMVMASNQSRPRLQTETTAWKRKARSCKVAG